MTDFAHEEFNEISNSLRKGKYDLELVLRVKNFKSQAPLKPRSGQTWEAVLETIHEALKEAEEKEDICAPIKRLCEIQGISVPTASALLAAKYPDRFAIIDSKMFKFFQCEEAYEKIREIFNRSTLAMKN